MLGQPTSLSAQLAAERHAAFAAEASSASWRRLSRQSHPAPRCGSIAAQLPDGLVDLCDDADAEPSLRT